MRPLAVLLLLICWPGAAMAHGVIADIFASGGQIEGEIAFSSGHVAAGATVIVTDPQGTALGETITNDDGFFSFVPVQPVAHHFRADLGSGHVAVMVMAEAEIRALMMGQSPRPATPSDEVRPEASATTTEDQQALATLIRQETRLLKREIAALRERQTFQSILGGIGYIAGLFGLGFYLAARHRLDR
ncbi:carboxypeptidase-like regulatory domain-containing protein [Actibacterium sp. 188UL27-1]|uniref:carboxypeptidase-like regulatory domain-containing protein n=1 Tax=Actibacterium sp. 188UL27-1 TaxID=2786961 RepID=UPI00195617BA|nr:carboxypeptidase-like regulatory domain-containing protein [Actibacterium sp. 188UL27-1]MBM7066350.1 carboxypeptidase regulatory-like domain-containing protein [Actibacterium sp. 188UL27-1]